MSFARYLTAGAMALATTLGLLLLMHILIQSDVKAPEQGATYKVPNIVMPERKIDTRFDVSKPERPDEPQEAPPDIPQPEFDNMEAVSGGISIQPTFGDKAQISGPASFGGDGEMIPLTVVQPEYPRRAAQRGLEGYCTVSLTVGANGATKDITIDDCPEEVFGRPSIRAAERLKYKPRVVDGQPVDVPGVKYKFTFQMAKD